MFTHLKKFFAATAVALAVLPAMAADTLKIGVLPGVYADAIHAAAKDAKAQGLEVKVVEFTDWTTPNVAVDSGDLDINFFQHQPFLDNAVKKNGFKLTSAGTSFLANVGLYSLKHKTVDAVPTNGKVGIANDPVNQGRGLLLLQKAGLIKLKPEVGFLGTLDDIVENPKKLSFVEVEGPQLVRITGDVDIAQGFPYFILASKAFDATKALALTSYEDDSWAIQFVARSDKAADPRIAQFLAVYKNSPAVRQTIHQFYQGEQKLYRLAWLKK